MAPKRVGFLGFDGLTALDLVGPLEAFTTAKVDRGDDDPRGYEVLILTESDETFASESVVGSNPAWRRKLRSPHPAR